ncbi:MOFRL family protein [Allorhizobium sp. NPDC080224]|uniref:MOFRL family protein n=1 Tax=Allorhizobium sp. NPDC080224 TaxID=3390547 RepID=UPI003D031330
MRLLGDALEGQALEVAAAQAKKLAVQIAGPNTEFCLALALALDGAEGVQALACDTSNFVGAAEVAGTVIGPNGLKDAADCTCDPRPALKRNDAHYLFAALDI